MKKAVMIALSVGLFSNWAFAKKEAVKTTVALDKMIQELENSNKKNMKVSVSGEISAVCQAKGCWITLKSSDLKKTDTCEETLKGASTQSEVRVMMKDHSFAVPKDLKGTVTVVGELKKKKLSSFQLKHLLKDAGCSKEQMKKAKKSLNKYQIVATDIYSKEGVHYRAD